MKAGKISPSWFYYPEYLLSATLRWRSDDEQTRYDPHVYKMTLRRIEHDGRYYEETRYLRNGYPRCPLTGGEPSLSRLPSGAPVEGRQHSLIRMFLPASSLYPATDGGRGGSPRVDDRSGPLAVLPSSPLVLHQRYTMTSAKRQAWSFPANGFCRMKWTKRGIQMY